MRRRVVKVENKDRQKKIIQAITMLILLFFIFLMASSFMHSVTLMREKLNILDKVEDEVDYLRLDNLELVLQKNDIVSYEYLEKEARDKLRYGIDGETVFIIPEELMSSDVLKKELDKAKGVELKDEYRGREQIFDIWLDFLFVTGI